MNEAHQKDGDTRQIDMTRAIHLRMVPEKVRPRLQGADGIDDTVRDEVLRRFFPSIAEETLFWAQAQKCRGVALYDSGSIRFVPEDELRKQIAGRDCIDGARLSEVLDRYDPHRQVIVVMKLGCWCEIFVASQAEQPVSLARYPAS